MDEGEAARQICPRDLLREVKRVEVKGVQKNAG